jgi:peptidyl-prolyl cis-trans isomerase D
MLDGIRKAAQNWLGRIVLVFIMSILILSFAVWGIGDMLRVTGQSTVATVGGVEIGVEQVRRTWQNALEDLSNRARRRITADEAKALGLDRQVITRLVSEAVLDQRAGKLGLNLPEASVVSAVTNDRTFAGADGKFDRMRFYELLRQNGLNEPAFFQEQKKSMLRRQIGVGIGGDLPPSKALLEAAHRFISEERTVDYFILPPSMAGDIPAPTDEALKEYYEGRKFEFRAPEYRKINIVAALPSELGVEITVTEADLKAIYDRGLLTGRWGAPARRQVQQVLFQNEGEAIAGALRAQTGGFDALMTQRNVKPEDADLGLKSRAQYADPAIAAVAFALEEGAVSAPVRTNFGFAVLRLVKIDPGSEQPFDQVKDSLQDEARNDKIRRDPRIQTRLDDIQKKIEEARTAGKSLAEAVPAAGLKVQTIEAIDAKGLDKTGNRIEIPGGDETVRAIFQSDIGLDNEALRLRQGGLLWFEITNVESARDRPFEEVKADVALRWRTDEATKRLRAKADELIKRLDAGEDFGIVASDNSVEAVEAKVTRNNSGALGSTGAAQAFSVPVGKSASAATPEGGRLVLRVRAASTTPFDPATGVGAELNRQIAEQIGEDIVTQYIQKLQTELGASINQRALQTAIGGGQPGG